MLRSRRWMVLALVLLTGACLAGGAWGLHRYQTRRTAACLAAEGRQALEQGDDATAAPLLEQALALRPADTGLRHALADALFATAKSRPEFLRAFEVAEQVLREEPGQTALRWRQVDLALRLERGSDALHHLKALSTDGENGRAAFLRAQAYEQLGDPRSAIEEYQAAIQSSFREPQAFERLAILARAQGRPSAQSDALIQQSIDANPGSALAWMGKARYCQKFGTTEDAFAAAAKAVELAPDDPDALRLAGRLLVEQTGEPSIARLDAPVRQTLDVVRAALLRRAETHPFEIETALLAAHLQPQGASSVAAFRCLETCLQHHPGEPRLLATLADLSIAAGRIDEARRLLESLTKAPESAATFHYLSGRLEVSEGRLASAIAQFELARTAGTADTDIAEKIHWQLAQQHEALGRTTEALAAYRQTIRINPRCLPARAALAAFLLRSHQRREAIAEYRQLTALPGMRHIVARLLFEETLKSPPEFRDWTEIQRLVAESREERPEGAEWRLIETQRLAARGELDAAESQLSEALRQQPSSTELWIARARLAEARSGSARASAILDEARRSGVDDPWVRIEQARQILVGGAAALPAVRLLESETEKWPTGDRQTLWRGLARQLEREGWLAESQRLWGKLGDQDAEALGSRLELAFRMDDLVHLQQAASQMAAVLPPADPRRQFGEAASQILRFRQGTEGSLDEPRRSLSRLIQRQPSWHVARLALATCCELQRDLDAAMEQFQAMIDGGWRDKASLHRMMQLLDAAGRFDEAQKLLQSLTASAPQSARTEYQLFASEVTGQLQRPDLALEWARSTLAGGQTAIHRDMQLGHALAASRDYPAAQAAFRRAMATAPQESVPFKALLDAMVKGGDVPGAKTALDRAVSSQSPVLSLRDRAESFAIVENPEAARRDFQAVLKDSPDDALALRGLATLEIRNGRPLAAIDCLQRLTQRAAPDSQGQRRWARRTLAVLLASRSQADDMRSSTALLDANDRDGLPEPDDRRARAFVEAARRRPESDRAAVEILSRLERDRLLLPKDRRLLVELYERLGETDAAQTQFRSLLSHQPVELSDARRYTRFLLDQRRFSEADPWIQYLGKHAPDEFETVALTARRDWLQGAFDAGAAALRRFTASQTGTAEDQAARLALAAAWCEQSSREPAMERANAGAALQQEAGTLYRTLAERHPRRVPMVAAYEARQGRPKDALSRLVASIDRTDIGQSAPLVVALCVQSRATPEELARAEHALTQANERIPHTAAEQALADLALLQQRYDTAATRFERLASRDPRHAAARNNLAWLLAIRELRLDDAERFIGEAIRLEGAAAAYLDTRGVVHLARKRWREAIADFEKAAAESSSAMLQVRLAVAHLEAGERDIARSLWRKARRMPTLVEESTPLEQRFLNRLAAEFP